MTLEVRNVSKRFYDKARGEFFGCQDISFDVKPGEVYGLLGPNGAGKTTTLRVVSTIYKPTTGTATISGVDVNSQPEKARRLLGFLSSTSGLYERLTAREILLYFGRLCDVPEDLLLKRVETLFEALDFKTYADTRVAKLSQGTRQKVSIARSIIHDPLLMILDEPSTGLDVLASYAMHEFVRKEKADGKCFLLSTHTMSEAEKLCDRIGIISEGRLLASGTIDELREFTGSTGREGLEDIFISILQKQKPGENLEDKN